MPMDVLMGQPTAPHTGKRGTASQLQRSIERIGMLLLHLCTLEE